MAESKVSMKLLMDTKGKRVLFAQGRGPVTYMVMDDLEVKPMSTISTITLLNHFHVHNVGALKEKVVNLGIKEGLKLLKASLQSKNVLTDVFCILIEKMLYKCTYCSANNISDDPRADCPTRHRKLSKRVTYVAPPAVQPTPGHGGLVNGVVSYMVMDNLEVNPMSTISSIALLNKFNVKDVGVLEERVVNLGIISIFNLFIYLFIHSDVLTP